MTEQEILDGNELIAKFMYPQRDKRRKDYPFPFAVIQVVPAEDIIGYGKVPEGEIKHFSGPPNMIKYHSSWDWLMPVVEKIEGLGHIITIRDQDCWIDLNTGEEFGAGSQGSKLSSIYVAVIDFIKWYNKQQNK
jgi:hypothetical protein